MVRLEMEKTKQKMEQGLTEISNLEAASTLWQHIEKKPLLRLKKAKRSLQGKLSRARRSKKADRAERMTLFAAELRETTKKLKQLEMRKANQKKELNRLKEHTATLKKSFSTLLTQLKDMIQQRSKKEEGLDTDYSK